MKFKFNAGAELDLLTKDEVRAELAHAQASWIGEVSRGIRFRRVSIYGDADGAGAVTIGATGESTAGPDQGMVWMLRRLSVTDYDPAATALALYNGSVSDSAVIVPKLATWQTDMDEVLMPGERLVVAGTVAASARVWVTAQVKEAPISLLWRL